MFYFDMKLIEIESKVTVVQYEYIKHTYTSFNNAFVNAMYKCQKLIFFILFVSVVVIDKVKIKCFSAIGKLEIISKEKKN